MTTVLDNFKTTQETYQTELLRIMSEVEAEFKKINYAGKDRRPVQAIIDEQLAKKRATDKRYIQAKLACENAKKEFDSLMSKF
jgi:hypothetical protein